MKRFDYLEPSTVEETLDLLHRYGNKAKVLAGGTDLIVQMKQRKVVPELVIGLGRLKELNFIKIDSDLRIGPLTTMSQIATQSAFCGRLVLLREAASAVGDVQIRNVATVGGNIANASPSADLSPALLAMGAKLKLRRRGGERLVNLHEVCLGPFCTQLTEEELIVEIFVSPFPKGSGAYAWTPKRTSVDETLVGVGVWLIPDPTKKKCLRASIALGSVGPWAFKASKAEAFLQGKALNRDSFRKAGEIAAEEASPRSRADYRRTMVSILTEEALAQALARMELPT